MKKIFVNLVLVLSPFAMGLYAQCDSNDLKDVVIWFDNSHLKFDPKAYEGELRPEGWVEPFDTSEWRRIYFVHGLGGDKSAWSKAAEACEIGVPKLNFPARKCETIRVDYTNSTSTLYDAASAVRNGIGNQADIDRVRGILDPARAIVIAHSQGGVVMRELMHLDMVQPGQNGTGHTTLHAGMNYGGVVTVASPLQGAAILTSRDKNEISNFAQSACSTLVAGFEYEAMYTVEANVLSQIPDKIKILWIIPVYSLVDIKSSLRKWVANTLGAVAEKGCDVVGNVAIPMFFNDMYAGVTSGYKVGCDTIIALNQDVTNSKYAAFHKMAFYAVEPQENLFWRTLNWMVTSPNTKSPFQANDDWNLYDNSVKPMIDFYQAKTELYLALYNFHNISMFYVKKSDKVKAQIAALNALGTFCAYKEGSNWFNNANESWQTIIGAKTYNPTTGKVIIDPNNDGVVMAESAKNMPKATHGPVKIYPNETSTVDFEKGSSHMQVRNDAGIKTALKDLFDGKLERWFFVAEDHQ